MLTTLKAVLKTAPPTGETVRIFRPLTDREIRNAKPSDKSYKMFDGGGLYLEVDPSGGKWWRFKYRIPREKRISLGVYPAVSLADARELRDEKRRLVAKGIDPSEQRKAIKSARADRAENTFEVIATEWLGKFIDPMSTSHSKRVHARFTNGVFPTIGSRPIAEITRAELINALYLCQIWHGHLRDSANNP
jgi:hypothetical protein